MTLLRLTVKNIADRWIRFLLTGLAVVLGVGFVVGTFIATDGLRSTFSDLAEDIGGLTELYVRPDQEFGDNLGAPVDPAWAERIAEIDGVEFAEPGIFAVGISVSDDDGETIGGSDNFRAGLSFGRGTGTFLVTEGPLAGRPPEGPAEFVLNSTAVEDADLVIGETYLVAGRSTVDALREMTLVGAFNWADPADDQFVGSSLVAVDLETAQEFFYDGENVTEVAVGLEQGADIDAVRAEISAMLDDGLEVVTSEIVTDENQEDFDEFLDVFGNILLSFAIVTVVVAAFIIYNTFSIVIGQRIRELGLLRAVGATGRQVTWSLIGEAAVVAILATAAGIAGGIGVGWVLKQVLSGLGAGFPDGPLPVRARTIVVGAVLGIAVTVLSAVIPALRARRVPPMAALREDITLATAGPRLRTRVGPALLGVGLVVLGLGVISGASVTPLALVAAVLMYFGGSRTRPFLGRFSIITVGVVLLVVAAVADLSTAALLGALAVGALLTFVGVNLVSPLFARPLSAVVGTKSLGIVLLVLFAGLVAATVVSLVLAGRAAVDASTGGLIGWALLALLAAAGAWLCGTTWRAPWRVEGRIGTENAGRTPRRTSSTAAALMIGLALVGTVTVIGASLKKTFTEVLDRSVTADWFICLDDCNSFFDGFSPQMAQQLAGLDELDTVIPYRFAEEAFKTVADDAVHGVLTADFEHLDEHLDPDYVSGGASGAPDDSILLHENPAEDLEVSVGDDLEIEFATGERATFSVAGIYSDSRILGDWVISNAAYATYLPPGEDQFVSAVTADGVAEENARAAVEGVTGQFPDVEVRTKDEFRDSQAAQVDEALVAVNVFLALALIIALVGIANTLALSVFERTREIGLLRAVGATRAQTSMLIRWEGAIIAVFGGILGIVLGIVFGAIAVIVIPDSIVDQFDVPPIQLAGYVVAAALAGLVAAYLPARRAGRLDVLQAIANE